MRVLGLDTATMAASAAVVEDGNWVAEFTLHTEKVHSRRLMPLLAAMLEESGLAIGDIDGIAVSAGPGSFTGLRIGMTAAKGLAYALNKPIVRISTLAALAFNLTYASGLVCPILDARMQEVYTAVYRTGGGEPESVLAPAAMPVDALLANITGQDERVVFLGDAISKYRDAITDRLGAQAVWAPPHLSLPRAASVAELGRRRLLRNDSDDCFTVQPYYLRRSQAEILMEAKRRERNDGWCGGLPDGR